MLFYNGNVLFTNQVKSIKFLLNRETVMKKSKQMKQTQSERSFRLSLKESRELCLFGFRVQFRFKFYISR